MEAMCIASLLIGSEVRRPPSILLFYCKQALPSPSSSINDLRRSMDTTRKLSWNDDKVMIQLHQIDVQADRVKDGQPDQQTRLLITLHLVDFWSCVNVTDLLQYEASGLAVCGSGDFGQSVRWQRSGARAGRLSYTPGTFFVLSCLPLLASRLALLHAGNTSHYINAVKWQDTVQCGSSATAPGQ